MERVATQPDVIPLREPVRLADGTVTSAIRVSPGQVRARPLTLPRHPLNALNSPSISFYVILFMMEPNAPRHATGREHPDHRDPPRGRRVGRRGRVPARALALGRVRTGRDAAGREARVGVRAYPRVQRRSKELCGAAAWCVALSIFSCFISVNVDLYCYFVAVFQYKVHRVFLFTSRAVLT